MSPINRRQFLCSSMLACLPLSFSAASYGAVLLKAYVLGAQGRQADDYGLGWAQSSLNASDNSLSRKGSVNLTGNDVTLQAIGFRGHGYAYTPQRPNRVVAFARRPGVEAVVVYMEEQRVEPAFTCTQGFHLLGHGCFNADGTRLYTAESDYVNGEE